MEATASSPSKSSKNNLCGSQPLRFWGWFSHGNPQQNGDEGRMRIEPSLITSSLQVSGKARIIVVLGMHLQKRKYVWVEEGAIVIREVPNKREL